jgi:hypothetical protein
MLEVYLIELRFCGYDTGTKWRCAFPCYLWRLCCRHGDALLDLKLKLVGAVTLHNGDARQLTKPFVPDKRSRQNGDAAHGSSTSVVEVTKAIDQIFP